MSATWKWSIETAERHQPVKYSFIFFNLSKTDIHLEQITNAPLPVTHGVVLTSTFFHTQQDNKAINIGIAVRPIASLFRASE